jgi:hypothetical protein
MPEDMLNHLSILSRIRLLSRLKLAVCLSGWIVSALLIGLYLVSANKTSVIVIFPQNTSTEKLGDDELDGVHFPASHISIVRGADAGRPFLLRVNDITFSAHRKKDMRICRHY